MFVHNVYFWLRDDLTDQEEKAFVEGLESLTEIDLVNEAFVGRPAGTPREVVDNSFAYSLILEFDDADDQDAYQTHPVHEEFVETCESFWNRVQVYDSLKV